MPQRHNDHKDDCKKREKKCERERRHHGHHGHGRKKCEPKKPWCPPARRNKCHD